MCQWHLPLAPVAGSPHISEQKEKAEAPLCVAISQICILRKAKPPEMGFDSSQKYSGSVLLLLFPCGGAGSSLEILA